MSNPTLVLSRRYTEDSILLWRVAGQLGWHTERLVDWKVPESLGLADVVIYGEQLFADNVCQSLNVQVLSPDDIWVKGLPVELTQRKISITTLGELRRDWPGVIFVKPLLVKDFPAGVLDSAIQLPSREFWADDVAALVAEPIRWSCEYRCFILDGQVMTASIYMRDGKLAKDDAGNWITDPIEEAEAITFCSNVVAGRRDLPRAVVVDVGVIACRGWAVVEANPAWGSGLYNCDAGKALETIRQATVRPRQ